MLFIDDPQGTFYTFCHSDFVSLSHQFEFFFQSPVLFTQMMNHFVVEILGIQEKTKIIKASFYSIYQSVHSESIIWLPEIQSVKCTLRSCYRAGPGLGLLLGTKRAITIPYCFSHLILQLSFTVSSSIGIIEFYLIKSPRLVTLENVYFSFKDFYLVVSTLALGSGHATDETVRQFFKFLVLNFGKMLVNLDTGRPT